MFFSQVVQTEMPYEGHVFKSPFFIRDANVIGAFFLCDYDQAKVLCAPHRPLKLPFGKALFAVNCIEYKDTDIGPYNEVALSVLVQPLRSLVRAKFHAHIIHLPVSTELSVAGGKGLLHYPKFLADITFRDTGTHRICTLRDKATLDLILELECPKLKKKKRRLGLWKRQLSVDTYVAGQVLSNATFKMHLLVAAQSFLWPRVGLRFGKHGVAEQLKTLRIGQQAGYVNVPRCEGMLVKNAN